MRRQSHLSLGQHLTRHHLAGISKRKKQAFLFGCIEPDFNPFTYFKGFSHHNILQGHHFRSSQCHRERLANHLMHQRHWGVLEYYSLGKLVHYTADAFTLAHNHHFHGGLKAHRIYENQLQKYFLHQLEQDLLAPLPCCDDISALIRQLHREYIRQIPGIETDTAYIQRACHGILSILRP